MVDLSLDRGGWQKWSYPRAFLPKLAPPAINGQVKVVVEPVQDLFDEHIGRRNMAGFEHYMPLVFFGSAEHAEHRILGGFLGEEEIVAAVDHQNRQLHARREIEWV